MDEVRSTPAAQRENQSQIRRAQLGVVAGYIHEMAERHGTQSAAASPPDMPVPRQSRGHS